MLQAGVAELKAHLSRFLRVARSGEEVLITERGRPVARLVPIDECAAERPAHLMEMERRGEVRIGSGAAPTGADLPPLPAPTEGMTALEALVEERRGSR